MKLFSLLGILGRSITFMWLSGINKYFCVLRCWNFSPVWYRSVNCLLSFKRPTPSAQPWLRRPWWMKGAWVGSPLPASLLSHSSWFFCCFWILQYCNQELSDIQARFRKGTGTRDQIANIHWITEKAREFQENIYFCFIDYTKAFDCVDHNKLWKIHKEMGIQDHLTCLLRNLYAGQEATVRTGNGKTDWFQTGKRSMLRLYIITLLV